MRIKRTDKSFTVRKKEERKIRYAGKKNNTGNTTGFSPKEKQDMLRQKELSGGEQGGRRHGYRDHTILILAGEKFMQEVQEVFISRSKGKTVSVEIKV